MAKICNLSIAEVLASVPAISSPPEIVFSANELIDNPSKTTKDIAEVIETDPGLTARLLQIVNSAFYGFPTKISSVAKAITIIGTKELYQLVLTTVVIRQISHLSITVLSMDQFWSSSLKCGLFGKVLADEYMKHHDLESVFVSGLLHNIGQLLLCHKLPEFMRSSTLLAESKNIKDFEAEQSLIGFDRYQLGAVWAKQWRFPEIIISTMQNHPRPTDANRYILESNLVYLADSLSRIDTKSPESLEICVTEHQAILKFLGITPEMIDSIIPVVDNQFKEIFEKLFGRRCKSESAS